MRSLFSIIENRSPLAKEVFSQTKALVVLVGVNAFRNNQANLRQELVRQVGKQFFVKSSSKDRLGFVHSSIGSLSFSHLGLSGKKFVAKASTFVVGQPDYYEVSSTKKAFSPTNFGITALRSKTMYEFSGHLRSLQGQRRKHVKVINPVVVDQTSKLNFEAELITF